MYLYQHRFTHNGRTIHLEVQGCGQAIGVYDKSLTEPLITEIPTDNGYITKNSLEIVKAALASIDQANTPKTTEARIDQLLNRIDHVVERLERLAA